MINTEYEFCGGNIVNDERRRFELDGEFDYKEIDPLTPWENLTYYGDMNMGATICGVSFFSQFFANKLSTTGFYVKLQGDSGGPVFIPVVVEKEDYSLTEEEILNLVRTNKTKISGKTEAEILNNLVRDPILIGVTR